MFAVDALEESLTGAGIGVDRSTLRPGFDQRVASVLGQATLPLSAYPRAVLGGRSGHHSEHLGHLLATMQFLPRAYPDAIW